MRTRTVRIMNVKAGTRRTASSITNTLTRKDENKNKNRKNNEYKGMKKKNRKSNKCKGKKNKVI